MLLDAMCQPVELGAEIGRGGEGTVYELARDPSLVVKVYHKIPLPEDQVNKLNALTEGWSAEVERISSWPRAVLFDPTKRQPCGLLMSKMTSTLPLHELYGTTNRRRHFPDAGWHHLVLAARNVASVFDTLHSAGVVVGDINQGNLLVDQKMTVRMIDCDSFQISHNGVTYKCPVGSPHFTPPELQGLRLRDVQRTQNHDRFGLAILIFHLLFVGRHPFAGRYRGAGDMSIEKAIGERRFAFSRNRAATMIDPPPASLLLDDLPKPIGELFERAFRSTGESADPRPSPQQWMEHLEALLKRRRTCDTDALHVYPAEVHCPWCRIEDMGGPSFFVSADAPSVVGSNRLARLEAKVDQLKEVQFPQLSAERFKPPKISRVRGFKSPKNWNKLDLAAVALSAAWITSIVGMSYASLPTIITGAVLSVCSAGFLLWNNRSREQRLAARAQRDDLVKRKQLILQHAHGIQQQHLERLQAFEDSLSDLEFEKKNYLAEGDDVAKVIVESRYLQMDEFLRDHSIHDLRQRIFGLTESHVVLLESYGIESAYDVEKIKLYGVPSISNTLMIELLNWRRDVERDFVFRPEHGVTLDNLKSIESAAFQRFKMSQARKILMGDERLKAQAGAGKDALVQVLTAYDNEVRQWRQSADLYTVSQKTRTLLERLLNRSPAVWFVAPAVLIPALAGLIYYLLQRP